MKNISGLWLVQECKRQWDLEGDPLGYGEMATLANQATPFSAFIDPDDSCFASPGDMPEKIRAFCARSGQSVPDDKGQILRVVTESLALKYRVVYENIRKLTGLDFKCLNAGGGGIQNALLSQATADALGIEIVCGPVEATSCGNVITQMIGTGYLTNLEAGRDLIRRSFERSVFTPGDSLAWDDAFTRFKAILTLG